MNYDYLYNIAPLLMQVELTEACNLRCRFCYNSQKPRYNVHAFEILDKLADQGVMQVNLTGGEPLAHPQFFDILRHACELFPNVVLLSNGSLMNRDILDKIHDTKVTSVNISIHGNREIHDSLTMTPGSYDASIAAIKFFIEAKKILVASNFVINAENLHILKDTIDFFNSIGLDYMTMTRFVPVGIGNNAKELNLTAKQLIEAFQIVYDYNNSGKGPHIEIAEAIPFCAIPKHLQSIANCCSYGYDRFYVDVTGDVLVCGLSRIKLGGNILNNTLSEIKHNSSVFQKFVENQHVSDICAKCDMYPLCHGGCRASAMSTGGWEKVNDSYMTR